MIADRNIVCVASNWFAHPTSKQHVMRLLSERNHVVWVNFHASRRPSFSAGDSKVIGKRLKQMLAKPQRVAPTIDVVSPLVAPLPENGFARVFNGWNIARQIKAVLKTLPERPTQLWLFTPDTPEIISRLKAECVLYYCVDDFAAFDGYNADLVTNLEQRTVSKSDVVIATSQPLLERMRAMHDNTHFVAHGVDYDHFASATAMAKDDVPEDVQDVAGPTFGYFGLISEYVDLGLIAAVARRKPEWNFLLLGDARCDTSVCEGLPNVRLLGARPYETLPHYCRAMDVGIIPFRMSRLVHAVNPIKLREYLAAGLPVISSRMPEVMRYGDAVFAAETCDEFIAAGEKALWASRTGVEARQELVANESWRARVDQLSEIVSKAVQARETAPQPVSV